MGLGRAGGFEDGELEMGFGMKAGRGGRWVWVRRWVEEEDGLGRDGLGRELD